MFFVGEGASLVLNGLNDDLAGVGADTLTRDLGYSPLSLQPPLIVVASPRFPPLF